MGRNVLVLEGGRRGDASRASLAVLMEGLERRGDTVRVISEDSHRFANCVGCFRCWIKTPGVCVIGDDGAELVRAVIGSDLLVLLGPISFGGYGAALKRMIDRFALPALLPYFTTVCSETHHPLRYAKAPRLLALGIQERADARDAAIFRTLVARNAINFHSPSYAVEIVDAEASAQELHRDLNGALDREDPRPSRADLDALIPEPHAAVLGDGNPPPRRALLVVGSPKVGPSTSAVLGHHLVEKLAQHGIGTSEVVLKSALRSQAVQQALAVEFCRADLIILAFPLYVDSLPTLVTLALESVGAAIALASRGACRKRLLVICNSGFPEAHQNTLALAMCERFAAQTGLHYCGGLMLGSGEAIVGGAPLAGAARGGRPPTFHVIEALDLAAVALSRGENVPRKSNTLLAKSPIPFLPFAVWRWIYRWVGSRNWQEEAAKNGVEAKRLVARPASVGSAMAFEGLSACSGSPPWP